VQKLTLSRLLLIHLSLCSLLCVIHAQTRTARSGASELLVANQGDHTISVIDTVAARQVATIPESGITGHEVAVIPGTRTAFVPIYGNSGVGKPGTDGASIDVLDIPNGKLLAKIDFSHGVRPHCAVYEPVSGLLYVTTELDKTVTVIDPRMFKIVGSIPTTQAESHMLAISHDGRRGYTANVGPGTVSVLDLKARKTVKVIPISGTTQRISISNDDRLVFTADQIKPQMAAIDTTTNTIKTWIPLPALGYGTAPTRDGRWLLATIPSLNEIAVINLQSLKVERTITVGNHPTEILVRPDGAVAYVACMRGNQIAAIDISQWKVQAMIDAGSGADGLAWSQQ
jgi:DNA-binding beta-propeller fold protein YncE